MILLNNIPKFVLTNLTQQNRSKILTTQLNELFFVFEMIRREISLLWIGKDYERFADLHEVYENGDTVQMITTWCPRGDLEAHILSKNRPVTEREVASNSGFW